MRSPVVRAIAVLLVLPAGAGAQTISLTEAQALAQLSPDHPLVRAINTPIDAARAGVLIAGRRPNPRVTYDRESVAGVTEHLAMVGQVLPLSGRRSLEVAAASMLVDAASSRTSDQLRRLRADVRLAFADLVAAQQQERELAAVHDRLQQLAAVLAKREAAGDAAGFDRLRADREALEVEIDRAGAAAERRRAEATLAGFINPPAAGVSITAVAPSPARAVVPTLDELLSRAEQSRGEIVALRRESESASLAERAAGRLLIPEPEVVAGTKSSSAGRGDIGSVISVHVPIPLFDRGRPERAAASARRTQAEARLEALRATLRSQVVMWREAVIERRAIADRYRGTSVQAAVELERIAQVSYDAGERGILELLDAYRVAATARVRQGALDLAARQAELELEFVSGWEIP
jgi:cobalt-zinc-cadmium efflux system outer membrane protein